MKSLKSMIYLLCLLTSITLHAQKRAKPNLIWIITDEHNFRTLGCYRDQLSPEQAFLWGPKAYAETPNINSLAEYGTIFNRMYGSAPVCTPSRASMFTGLYPATLGIPNNSNKKGDGKYLKPEITTIADVLTKAGYMTGYAGKWHLAESRDDSGDKDKDEWWSPYPVGKPDDNYGFQDKKYMFNGGHEKFKGIDAEGNPYQAAKNPKKIGTDKYGQPIYEDNRSKNVKTTTDWLGDRAVEFIGAHKAEPFYYVVSIPDPHTPDVVREPYNTMFTNVGLQLPPTYKAAYDNQMNPDLPKWQKPDEKTKNPAKLKAEIQQYLGMVKNIDDNVGRILNKLKEEGILDNTIIVFSSDHGDLLGEHGRVNKGTIHEASARIPFIMAHGRTNKSPLIPRKKVVNQAANTADWMPTFLSILGVTCPKVSGRDLTPLLKETLSADWNDVTFVKLGFYAAVTEQYKLHLAVNEKPWLLDIKADPDELKNFIDDPKYKKIVKKLAQDLKGYMKSAPDRNDKIDAQLNELLGRS